MLFVHSVSAEVPPKEQKQMVSTVKKMIGFIRYEKNDKALSLIQTSLFSQNIMGKAYDTMNAEEKTDLEKAVQNYLVKKSFPKGLEYFKKLDLSYEKPIEKKGYYELPSSILYKGSERVKFSWVLVKTDDGFRLSDFLSEGRLTSETIRTKQIEPLLKKSDVKTVISKINQAAQK
jgi:ABC-type transporter MlaC component